MTNVTTFRNQPYATAVWRGQLGGIRQALLTVPQMNPQQSVSYQLQDFIGTAFDAGYQRVVADESGAIVKLLPAGGHVQGAS